MFSFTIVIVLCAIEITLETFEGSSVIITTSDASIAESEPNPPIAIPTSARVKTGASLIPSPTKITLPCFASINSSSFSTFCEGKSSE